MPDYIHYHKAKAQVPFIFVNQNEWNTVYPHCVCRRRIFDLFSFISEYGIRQYEKCAQKPNMTVLERLLTQTIRFIYCK